MSSKTIASGQLLADTDSWLLASDHVIALDVGTLPDFDATLERSMVSAVGTLGSFHSDGRVQKLSVERLVSQERIRKRAHEIFESGHRGSATDDWLSAERELLGV